MNNPAILKREKHMPWGDLIFDLRQWIAREDPKFFSDRNPVRLYEAVWRYLGRENVPLYAVADALDAMKMVPENRGDHWVLVFNHEHWQKWTAANGEG